MKHLCVDVEDPVLTFPCFLESFISHLLMSAPLDRVPGSSSSSTSGLILPERN